MLEPTDNTIQAGCLGNLNARLVFHGTSAHSARPWLGDNAIMRAVEGLAPLARLEPRDVEIQGLVFREVLSVTQIEGGIATNVIPALADCDAELPLRAEQNARGGRGAPARARGRRRRPRAARQLAAWSRRGRVSARAGAARRRRLRARAEAGVDAGRGVLGAGSRRGQPRARSDALRAHARRAGRDRGARGERTTRCCASPLRWPGDGAVSRARVAPGVSVRPARRGQGGRARPRHRADRLRHGRSDRADAGAHPARARRRTAADRRLPAGTGPARAA